ncbi:hypothetical protein EGY25_08400 [Brevundimonas intermedia]|uniref:Uncharacterized protein n=1 Tax=Brevundimonas intermedia TaxID=74315 RepID=A0A4Y9RT44_9CAUL|nr:hypothetical protein EGY25_08400 [Brevundimonas intermedia]
MIGLVVGSVGVVGIWLAAQIWLAFDHDLRGKILGPDHSATIQTPNGARVKVTMVVSSPFGRSEHQRKLEIQHGDRRLGVNLVDDWGPAARLSVYQTDQNGIAILGAEFEEVFFTLDPLKQTPQPNNSDSGRWTYLGAFDLRRSDDSESKTFNFNSDPSAECIPILMGGEPGGPYRTAFYQRSC